MALRATTPAVLDTGPADQLRYRQHRFFPDLERGHRQYWLRRFTEGWPDWVSTCGWLNIKAVHLWMVTYLSPWRSSNFLTSTKGLPVNEKCQNVKQLLGYFICNDRTRVLLTTLRRKRSCITTMMMRRTADYSLNYECVEAGSMYSLFFAAADPLGGLSTSAKPVSTVS